MQGERTSARRPLRFAGAAADTRTGTFIGRRSDLARIGALFEGGERLVTLVGAPGIGKTRLAREFAARVAGSFGGAYFCDLTGARTVGDLVGVLGRALGIPTVSGKDSADILERLGRSFAEDRGILLVLDNFDHLTLTGGPALLPLLDAAPHVRAIVTSRELLRIRGEYVHNVPPLSLPLDSSAESEALDLLLERVQRARGSDVISAGERAACAKIVRELDGIPLAIELAALRVGMLGGPEVQAMMNPRLALLSRAPRGLSQPRRTLRTAIDESWNILSAIEKSVLAQLSIFRGGFTVEALERVVSVPAGESVIEVAQTLREKSLLGARVAGEESTRFGLYLSIREYAAERLLETGELEAVRVRHSDYYVLKAEEASRRMNEADGRSALEALDADRENVVAVVEYVLAAEKATAEMANVALRAMIALTALALVKGPIFPHLSMFDSVIAFASRFDLEPLLHIFALAARASCHRVRGRVAEAERDQNAARSIAKSLGVRSVEAWAISELALSALSGGEVGRAIPLFEEALGIARDGGDVALQALSSSMLAEALRESGRPAEARALATEALALHRRNGNIGFEAFTSAVVALTLAEFGHYAEARATAERALPLSRSAGLGIYEGFALGAIAVAAHLQGDFDAAETLYTQALRILGALGEPRFEAGAHGYYGVLLFERGRHREARDELSKAVTILGAAGDDSRYAPLFRAFGRAVDANLGWLDASAGEELESSDVLHVAARFLRVHEILAHAREAEEKGNAALAQKHHGAAEAWFAETMASASVLESTQASFDVRLALRSVQCALGRELPSPEKPSARKNELVVSADASWYRLGRGKTISCRNHQSVRLVLLALVERRLSSPGVALTRIELVRAGWPGEQILDRAAKNRLNVLLNRLRTMGLRKAILTVDRGYLLDPSVAVRAVSAAQAMCAENPT